ncbi:hypothetical protein N5C16_00490 [Stenotrophomonas sp. GD03908]|uniref:hypothetical protein n=1 Tax=Stenotrophomonas sp. GD03908 TaxID=2975403 RepID=UPI00244B51D8|nr:hypothetical protein [Stenotrophomonas sp. GD03908]MDH0977743.1 hypothetical protein [Stenotrophomonas sp. GD03908]
MADFFDSYSRGFALGQQQKQDRQNRNMLAELQQIGPQVIAGDLAATDRAYALDPQRAQAFQAEGNRQQQQLFGLAKSLKQAATNPQMQAGIYRSAVPFLKRSFGAEIPDEFDAASVMPIVDQVLAVAENAPAMAGVGGNLLSQRVGDDGFIYNTFRDGRMVNTGVKADRQAWFRDQPGFEPEIVNKDGTVRSLGSQGGAMAPAAAGQGVQAGSGVGAVRMNIEGIPAAQQQRMAQTVSLMQQAGYPEEEIMGFLQSQLPPDVPGLPQAGSAPIQPMSRARPSAAQEAQATEMARQQVQLAALPTRLQLENDAALSRASGESQVKAQAEQAATSRSNNTAAKVYEEGMGGAIRALAGSSTGPIVGRLPALTSEQQIAEGGISAMAPVLKQMFRVAGEGTFTDKDQDLLMAMLPTRKDSPEAREAKAANVDNIVRAKLNMPPPQKATNPKTGETLYLRFGQWVKK